MSARPPFKQMGEAIDALDDSLDLLLSVQAIAEKMGDSLPEKALLHLGYRLWGEIRCIRDRIEATLEVVR